MFGMVPFVKAAGRSLGKIFKGREAKERLEKEVDDLGLDKSGVDIHVDEDGKVSVSGKAVSPGNEGKNHPGRWQCRRC